MNMASPCRRAGNVDLILRLEPIMLTIIQDRPHGIVHPSRIKLRHFGPYLNLQRLLLSVLLLHQPTPRPIPLAPLILCSIRLVPSLIFLCLWDGKSVKPRKGAHTLSIIIHDRQRGLTRVALSSSRLCQLTDHKPAITLGHSRQDGKCGLHRPVECISLIIIQERHHGMTPDCQQT